jgi:hypothetical protein
MNPKRLENTQASEQTVRESISIACGENTSAATYLALIAQVARMIDDLNDGDHGPVDVGYLAHLLLVALPRNPFFAQNAAYLVPLHDMVINAWQDSNEMDPDQRFAATKCWADFVNEIACVVAGLVHGYEYRRRHSPRIRALLYEGWDSLESSDSGELRPAETELPTIG